MKKPHITPVLGIVLSISAFVYLNCQKATTRSIDFSAVKNLILFDRSTVRQYDQNVERILKQRDSIIIPDLNVTAYVFTWGGETGGPWNRVLYFSQPPPRSFQCAFLYKGEYAMSKMKWIPGPIKSGENHSLGTQLTQVANSLGDDIRMDKEKMKVLLVAVMEGLLNCPKIRKSDMDSLDFNNLPKDRYDCFDFRFSKNEAFMQTIQNVKNEMTINPDPNVIFFHGELINGIWKGTVRQYDHRGRFCIELDYLNGDFAYTLWL